VTLLLALLLVACPPEGRAQHGQAMPAWEVAANRLKNRTGEPAAYSPVTIARMLVAGREEWTQAEGGELVGWVFKVKLADAESCNCFDPSRRDVHILLAGGPEVRDTRRMVVCEISPGHPLPRPRPGTRVSVRGWMFYDAHHEHEPGRGTCWEVHPITGIQEEK
jgi:hypothetical protein